MLTFNEEKINFNKEVSSKCWFLELNPVIMDYEYLCSSRGVLGPLSVGGFLLITVDSVLKCS